MNWLTTILQTFGKPFKWWVVIAPWEQGLRVRMGRTAKRLDPGIHFRFPFLDRVYAQSRRLRTLWETGQTISSLDGHPLTLAMAIHFSIEDVTVLYNAMASPDTTIRTRCAAAAARFISTTERCEITPDSIQKAVMDSVPDLAGISKLDVEVTGFTFTRVYRILMNDYQHSAGLYDIEHGERDGSR